MDPEGITTLGEEVMANYQTFLNKARFLHPLMVQRIEREDANFCRPSSGARERPIELLIMYRYGASEALAGVLVEDASALLGLLEPV